MSIGIEFIRRPEGWRLEFDRRLDLSNWEIELTPGKISCVPRPAEFLLMVFGATLFIGLAIFITAYAIKPNWLAVSDSSDLPANQLPGRSRMRLVALQLPEHVQSAQNASTIDDARQATQRLLDGLTQDMTPEEKSKFLADLDDRLQQKPIQRQPLDARFDQTLAWFVLLGRFLAVIPVGLFSLFGGVCLVRALRYFRDRVELTVHNNALVFQRPKLLGGIAERLFPLDQLAAVTCHAVRRRRRRHRPAYVQWFVQVVSTGPSLPPLEFDVEHADDGTDMTKPPPRVRSFAQAIGAMSGLRVLVRRP